jgi:formate-dependent phosphoribosylglycinamide formyltransferase (GAR transformylase)
VVGATTVRAWGTAARVATALEDGVRDTERRIVYNGPVLFDLMITFLVVRSFIDKLNGSNSIEHQL